MSLSLKQWIAEVEIHLLKNSKKDFMFHELSPELYNKSLLYKASARGYIKKVSYRVPYTEKYGYSGDRIAVWAIVKGVWNMNTIQKAIDTFGEENQINKTIE